MGVEPLGRPLLTARAVFRVLEVVGEKSFFGALHGGWTNRKATLGFNENQVAEHGPTA